MATYSGLDNMVQDQERPTLALLVSELERAYQTPIWRAVSEAAVAADVNLLCFVGGRLGGGADVPHEIQRNGLYELVNSSLVDGLIVVSSAIIHQGAPEDLRAFVNRFHGLPTVSVGLSLEGIPSVTVDSDSGMRAGLRHLIVDHGMKRIAFVRGPEGHFEAESRYRVYREELARYGIPFDADLVAPGDFVSSARACDLLLNKREVAFDALVAANDGMALSAIDELQRRGLRVPQDVAILGYDDAADSRFSLPPLTTVRQPTAAMGQTAAEMVLSLMRGETVDDVRLPSALVIRRSCGCLGPFSGVPVADRRSSPDAVAEDQTSAIGRLSLGELLPDFDWSAFDGENLRQLPLVFSAALLAPHGQEQAFLLQLEQMLQQMRDGTDFEVCHQVLSALWLKVLPSVVGHPGDLVRGAYLVGEARILISEMAQRYEASRAIVARRLDDAVREIGLDLLAAFDAANLMDVLVAELPRINVRSCLLALYEADTEAGSVRFTSYTPLPEWAELVLHYRDGARLPLEASGEGADAMRFGSRVLVPQAYLPSDRRYSFVVEPLTFEDTQLGFVLFEPGPREGTVYGDLRGHLSTALRGAQMAEERQRRARQLQIAVDVVRTSETGFDPDLLARHVVDVLQRSLDTHFVGLYLLEDQWATLWAGTGAVGDEMLSKGHRLRIGGSSAVGQCAITRQPKFARLADGGAIRLGDRYLGDTRVEWALPLVSGEVMHGVLSLRSANPKAFRRGDVTTLAAVADQIAGALENARLLSRTQNALSELELTQHRYQQQAWADYLAVARTTEFELSSDHPHDPTSRIVDEVNAAVTQRQSVASHIDGESAGPQSELIVPINYGGATIGALGIHDSASRRWTDDEISLVESVLERMGLAAENLRLLDETQRRVAIEQLTRSVTAEMRQTLEVDQVLQSAVRRIGEAFDAAEVSIRLTVEDAEPAANLPGGGVDANDTRKQEL